MTAEDINGLKDYLGATPKPEDFEIFWKERVEEADRVPLAAGQNRQAFQAWEWHFLLWTVRGRGDLERMREA